MKYLLEIIGNSNKMVMSNTVTLPEGMNLSVGTKIYLSDLLERIEGGSAILNDMCAKSIDANDYYEVTSSDICWSDIDNDFFNVIYLRHHLIIH